MVHSCSWGWQAGCLQQRASACGAPTEGVTITCAPPTLPFSTHHPFLFRNAPGLSHLGPILLRDSTMPTKHPHKMWFPSSRRASPQACCRVIPKSPPQSRQEGAGSGPPATPCLRRHTPAPELALAAAPRLQSAASVSASGGRFPSCPAACSASSPGAPAPPGGSALRCCWRHTCTCRHTRMYVSELSPRKSNPPAAGARLQPRTG